MSQSKQKNFWRMPDRSKLLLRRLSAKTDLIRPNEFLKAAELFGLGAHHTDQVAESYIQMFLPEVRKL